MESLIFSTIRYLPVTLSLLILMFPFVLWTVASLHGHINPFFPYVSDLGVVQPEESLFTFSMSSGAVLLMLFVLLRYYWTRSVLQEATSGSKVTGRKRASVVVATMVASSPVERAVGASMDTDTGTSAHRAIYSLLTGLAITIGFIGVGSFPNSNSTGIQVAHNLFAAFVFLSILFDIYFEWQMTTALGSVLTARYRLLILCLMAVFFLVYTFTGILSFVVNPNAFVSQELRLHWSPEQGGYWWHITSTSFEWLLILMLSPYTLTYHSLFAAAKSLNNKLTSIV